MSNPKELERMYRVDPETFIEDFSDAWKSHPESEVLAVWNQRLNYRDTTLNSKTYLNSKEFRLMVLFALIAGLSTRVVLYFTELNRISSFNLVFTVMIPITLYFLFHHPMNKKIVLWVLGIMLISMIYINFLPLQVSDSILLSYLHLPVLLWLLAGLSYTGDGWQRVNHRLSFLKLNGEF